MLPYSDERSRKLMRSVPYFSDLGDADLIAVSAALAEIRLDAGQIGFLEGEAGAGLYLIVTGRAKIFRVSPEGREQVLARLGPGDSCNEVPVVDGGANPASMAAIEPTTAWVWHRDQMDRLRREIPILNETIIRSLASRCRELVQRAYALTFQSVTARLADFLLRQGDLSQQGLTQEEIASHIGTVREMVGRALRNLENEHLVRVGRQQIEILDREGLRALL